MNEDQDIYRKPDPPPEKKEVYPEVDFTAADARALTRRRTGLFLTGMVVLLGISAWLVMEQERRGERTDLEDLRVDDPLQARLSRTNRAGTILISGDVTTALDGVDDSPAQDAPQGMDPQKIALAMGHLRVAEQYLRAKEFDKAEELAREALTVWPGMNAAQRTMGYIYTQRGQFDQAISILNEALKSDPGNPETYNMLAACYMHKGQMTQAEDLLQTALEIRPDYVFAFVNMGMLYLATGRYDWGADYLERSLDRLPDHPNIRNNLAVCLLRIGRYDQAREQLLHLVDTHPEVSAWYFNLAITYCEEKNYEEAMVWVRRAADRCSPMQFHRYISDSDFNELRKRPDFQEMVRLLYPELPDLPQVPAAP